MVLFCARQGGGIASKRAMPKRARVLKINAKQKPNQIDFWGRMGVATRPLADLTTPLAPGRGRGIGSEVSSPLGAREPTGLPRVLNNYINLPLLFKYIKKHNVKVVWTLHDCWSFTGQCPHFDIIGCDKWLTGCYSCPQYRDYPSSFVDRTKLMYKKKKKWFTGVRDMTLVTPSKWLAGLAARSFLAEYPVTVVNNGIDLARFRPIQSDVKERLGCADKFLLLGVSFGWGVKKGLDVFIELAKRLPPEYRIVLVGTDEETKKSLPDNIIAIQRTQDQKELAQIYSAADLFVNPTREENFPTVNIESLACGTPVLTFRTGGSPEILDETCGAVVPKNDVNDLIKAIQTICREKPYDSKACCLRAQEYEANDKFLDYVKIYESYINAERT